MAILKDLKYLMYQAGLVTVLTFLIGMLLFKDYNTTVMVFVMGWIIAGPFCLINSILLFLSDAVKNRTLKYVLIYGPVLISILWLVLIGNLNMSITPLVLVISVTITNMTWCHNSKGNYT
ncbi:hypothetical protein [Winogradskyella sp.]